jgi:hypothetical protein
VLYCTVMMRVIGKTEGGALILQGVESGLQMIARKESVILL